LHYAQLEFRNPLQAAPARSLCDSRRESKLEQSFKHALDQSAEAGTSAEPIANFQARAPSSLYNGIF